jgi:hypothetical protein
MLKIKDNVDLKELEKFGFKDFEAYYFKSVTRKRNIYIWKYNREIVDYLKDNTTYSGYKYEGEYKHIIRPYIKDLIEAGLVEKV